MNKTEKLLDKLKSDINDTKDIDNDSFVEQALTTLNELQKQLTLTDVGICPFEAYAVFCIECDRQGLKPIKHKDYLKMG